MTVYSLKLWSKYFEAVENGRKTFEIRKNDRDYQYGDILDLGEYDPDKQQYTGRILRTKVTFLLRDPPYVPEGYVCMSIKLI